MFVSDVDQINYMHVSISDAHIFINVISHYWYIECMEIINK